MKITLPNGVIIEGDQDELNGILKALDTEVIHKVEPKPMQPVRRMGRWGHNPNWKESVNAILDLAQEKQISYALAYKEVMGRDISASGYRFIHQAEKNRNRATPTPTPTPTPGRKKTRKRMTPARKKELKELFIQVAEKVQKNRCTIKDAWTALTGEARCPGPHYAKIHKTIMHLRRSKKSDQDKRSVRGKFMHSRAKSLIQGNPALRYEKALAMAAQEWMSFKESFKKKETDAKKDTLPKGKELQLIQDSNTNTILFQMIQRVVTGRGQLKLYPDGQMIGFSTVLEWEALCMRIMQESKDLAAYFGVENKFKIEFRHGERIIRYG